MTTEPRQEASEIVRGVISWDWESGSDWDDHYELVVDALDAAIELDNARHGPDDGRGETEQEEVEGRARLRLHEALSALREDET